MMLVGSTAVSTVPPELVTTLTQVPPGCVTVVVVVQAGWWRGGALGDGNAITNVHLSSSSRQLSHLARGGFTVRPKAIAVERAGAGAGAGRY